MENQIGKPFVVRFSEAYWKKGDFITSEQGTKLKVIKVYNYNFYRKILNYFGFPFKLMNCIKVQNIGLKNEL